MSNSNYKDALSAAMEELAHREPRTLFIGQSVRDAGTFMSTTLETVPLEQRIEFPVAEEMQAGVCIGLSLAGYIPVCIFPRWNFLLCAASQLVNHIDKMQPHVIVRVGVGSTQPLDPGPQHKGDMSHAFRLLMPNTPIIYLDRAERIVPEYMAALDRDGPTVLVEVADLY